MEPVIVIAGKVFTLDIEHSYEDDNGTRRGTLRLDNAPPDITDEQIKDLIKQTYAPATPPAAPSQE